MTNDSHHTAVASSPRIRAAEARDADEISRLCAELGYPVPPEDIAARLARFENIAEKYVAVATCSNSSLLGWIAAEHRVLLESGDRIEIVGLVVDATARRQGIGRALVAAAESWARARGITTIFVRSSVTRDASHRFYENIGYERAKTQHAYTKPVPAE